MDINRLLQDEVKASFNFFYHFTNLDPSSKGYGRQIEIVGLRISASPTEQELWWLTTQKQDQFFQGQNGESPSGKNDNRRTAEPKLAVQILPQSGSSPL